MSGGGGGTVETSESPRRRVLIVDDELGVRESLRMALKGAYEVTAVGSAPEAVQALAASPPDVVLLDIVMPGVDGMALLEELRSRFPNLPIIMLTATKTVKTAVQAMKLGAFHYITKPFDVDDLRAHLDKASEQAALVREVEELRSEVGRRYHIENIVGRSARMQAVFKTVLTVAPLKTTVLITGESGTGKELIARAIHRQSPRRDKPFVAVNPAAIADTLMESELFGHEKGAFTGAFQRKLGRFELAQAGTLFLDEIANLKPELQAKLLRVLQEREIERVGAGRAIKIDVRIIAATNVDLTEAVARGGFRDDLYYRLNVVHLAVPPLRARREDIPLLVRHFIRRFNHEFGKRIDGPTPEALAALCAYGWPGNVRELQNVVERSAVLVEGASIGVDDLPMELSVGAPGDTRSEAVPLNEATDRFERQMVLRMLDRVDGNVSEAARALGIHRNSLKAKLARWKIRARDLRSGAQ